VGHRSELSGLPRGGEVSELRDGALTAMQALSGAAAFAALSSPRVGAAVSPERAPSRLVEPRLLRKPAPTPGRDALLRALGPIAVLAGWSACSATGVLSEQTLSPPWAVARALGGLVATGVLWDNLSTSLLRAGAGLGVGLSLGLLLGLVTGLSRLGDQLLDPLLQMLRTIPFLAVAPLLVLWFGIGEQQKLLVIALATSFPFYLNTHGGVRGVDPKVVEAGEVFGLSRARLIRAIILPGALPSILVGLRQSLGVALIALIVAEQTNAPRGIGFLMMSAQQFFQTEVLLVCVLAYALWGLLGDLLVRLLERVLVPWRSARRAG
jgi:sulfonate transport system permease protein